MRATIASMKQLEYALIWAQSDMEFRPGLEFSISNQVRKKLVSHINFNQGRKEYFLYFILPGIENMYI